jgi:predicted nucleic acid-binding protein
MKALFADAYYFLALGNPDDTDHQRVLAFARRLSEPMVTTTWVLTEVGDASAAPRLRPGFLRLLEELRNDAYATVVPATQGLFERGVELYSKRPDKGWSLTDCISFTVMNDYQIVEALTGDHHFEQAGFRALLK